MNQRVKSRIFFFALLLLLASPSFGNSRILELQGAITDSQCAFNVHSNNGSHDDMIKTRSGGSSPKECTLRCAKGMGGSYVLAVQDHIYRLDNQAQAEKFAGETVKITGTLVDAKTNTLHIRSIEVVAGIKQ
jgi:hypothetical protein